MTKLTDEELAEVRALEEIIRRETFKAELVKGNTALVHNGQDYVKTQEGLIAILTQLKEQRLNAAFVRLGFKEGVKLQVDLNDGKVWKK